MTKYQEFKTDYTKSKIILLPNKYEGYIINKYPKK